MTDISIIIPIYNEEDTIFELMRQLKVVIKNSHRTFEVILVNDGSTDQSENILDSVYRENVNLVNIIQFSRNFGHQLAITAGMRHSHGRAVVIMDADLQDPPDVIGDFINAWEEGYDIVYGQRKEREGETVFKKITAKLFYKMLRLATSIDIPENVGDFYLLDRKVVNIINSLSERHRFMRGMVAWVGFKRKAVIYDRKARHAGCTKYSLWKMLKFSWDAMTSFSFAPLRFVSWLGAVISLTAFLAILVIVYFRLFTDATIVGWSSIMAAILFVGGVQLLALGIIGEYIARIGDDVKSRPLYAISRHLNREYDGSKV